MADEKIERNAPRSTSEATPHVYDSPEIVSQPSPPEEQRASSSRDGQPPEVADSPDEKRVSPTSDPEPNDGAKSSSQLSAAEIPLLETNEAGTAEEIPLGLTTQSSDATSEIENRPQPNSSPDPAIRLLLEAVLPRSSESVPTLFEGALLLPGLIGAAVGSMLVQPAIEATQVKSMAGAQIRSSQKINNVYNIDEDSNEQFDVDDSSSVSKSSPENVDLETDSSPTGSGVHEDSGSNVTEIIGAGNDSSPRIGTAIEEKGSSGIGVIETIGLESELSPLKVDPTVLISLSGATEKTELRNESSPPKTDSTIFSGNGTAENVWLRSELSPSKTDTFSVVKSRSTSVIPEKGQEVVSPKRKSPTKF